MSDLANVKVGDKVFLSRGGWGRSLEIKTVQKVGKLHITIDGAKYQIRSGRRAGDSGWYCGYARPYSEKEWVDYQRENGIKNMRYELRDFSWTGCDEAILEKVYAIVFPEKYAEAQAGRDKEG